MNGAGRNSSIKYYDSKLFYQGTYEKDFLDFMMANNKFDQLQRGIRFNYIFDGRNLTYRSDFLFDGNIIFEIKSDWTYGAYDDKKRSKNHAKFQSVINSNYKLFVVFNKNDFIEVDNNNIMVNLFLNKQKLNKLENLLNLIQ